MDPWQIYAMFEANSLCFVFGTWQCNVRFKTKRGLIDMMNIDRKRRKPAEKSWIMPQKERVGRIVYKLLNRKEDTNCQSINSFERKERRGGWHREEWRNKNGKNYTLWWYVGHDDRLIIVRQLLLFHRTHRWVIGAHCAVGAYANYWSVAFIVCNTALMII